MKKSRILAVACALLATLFLTRSTPGADATPPPGNMDEVKKLMSLTWDMNVLPEGADAGTLERMLARGQVVFMYDRPAPKVPWMCVAGVLVDAPVETAFAVAAGFEDYPNLVPMTDRAKVTPVAGLDNLYEVEFGIELLFSWLDINYSVYHFHRPPHRTDWAHASGEFDINSGFWQFLPADGGRRSMVFYSVYSLPRQSAVKALYDDEPALELMTNVATATMVVRVVRDEAERRAGKKLPPPRGRSTVEELFTEDPATMRLFAKKGKILVLEEGPTVYVTSATLVDASRETAYSVVRDFRSYPDFLPGVKQVKVLRETENVTAVEMDSRLKLWAFNFETGGKRDYKLSPPEKISWKIPRGNGDPVEGYWRFISLEGSSKTLLLNGNTEDIRGMGFIPRTALKMEPSLEHGMLAAQMTALMDGMKSRIDHASGGK